MSQALTLHELAERAKLLERHMVDGRIQKDADALSERIDAGYAKVDEAVLDGKPTDVLERAKAKIAEFEDQLKRTEHACLMPHYFEQVFLCVARDALKWSSVPKGSRIRVLLPDVFDLTVQLDNLPEEAPF